MTTWQIKGMLASYDHEVYWLPDGTADVRPKHPGAVLPDEVRWKFSAKRALFNRKKPKPKGLTEVEKAHCRKVKAFLEGGLGPAELVAFGRPDGSRVFIKDLEKVPTISLDDILPNPAPGEPYF